MSRRQERRVYPRFSGPAVAAAFVESDAARRKVALLDLSASGARWHDRGPVADGAKLRLVIKARRFFGREVSLDATVVWHDGISTGVRFLSVSDRARLDACLRQVGGGATTAATPQMDATAAFGRVALTLEPAAGAASQIIAFASACPSDGKSYVVSGVAAALASMGRQVLVVDADLHAPTQHLRFMTSGGPGVAELLTGRLDKAAAGALVQPSASGVALLPAGGGGPMGLLSHDSAERLASVVRRLGYPVVLVDCPPILTSPEALLLTQVADQTLLTVRSGVTRERDVAQALKLLETNGCPARGVILNDHADVIGELGIFTARPRAARVDLSVERADAMSIAGTEAISAGRLGAV